MYLVKGRTDPLHYVINPGFALAFHIILRLEAIIQITVHRWLNINKLGTHNAIGSNGKGGFFGNLHIILNFYLHQNPWAVGANGIYTAHGYTGVSHCITRSQTNGLTETNIKIIAFVSPKAKIRKKYKHCHYQGQAPHRKGTNLNLCIHPYASLPIYRPLRKALTRESSILRKLSTVSTAMSFPS